MAAVAPPRGLPALVGQPLSPGMRIGLLGGSFNPAHEGHRHISLEALRRLELDQVWWLVSPQNPLKEARHMAPFDDRRASAEAVARHPRIHVLDLERRLGTQFTADTLAHLVKLAPSIDFVFLMGADNFAQIPAWKRWPDIFETVPIAVLARAGFQYAAPLGRAAQRFAADRIAAEDAGRLPRMAPPAWVFLPTPLHPASSTQIRRRKN